MTFGQLMVLFHALRLIASRDFAVHPLRRVELCPRLRYFAHAQYIRNRDQHLRSFSSQLSTKVSRPGYSRADLLTHFTCQNLKFTPIRALAPAPGTRWLGCGRSM